MGNNFRFAMNIKLFIVMGVSWVIEIITSVVAAPPEWWYLVDAFNIFQGVLVFFIFVFKRRVFAEIRQRLGRMTSLNEGS